MQARSATALQHMVEIRKKLNLEIQIDPATIIVSAGGVFDENRPTLIAELGQLTMKTQDELPEQALQAVGTFKQFFENIFIISFAD